MFVHCALIGEASPGFKLVVEAMGHRALNATAGSRRLIYRESSFDFTLSRTCFFLFILFPYCWRFSVDTLVRRYALSFTVLPGACFGFIL